jgi:DNA gyrase subunit B
MVEVAMVYNAGYQENIFSYVNNINTIEGGTHVAGFRRSITRVFKSYGEKQGLFEKAKVVLKGMISGKVYQRNHFCKSS